MNVLNISGRTSSGFSLIYTYSFIDVANHNNTWINYCRYMVRFVESVWALCVKSLTRYGCEILNLFTTIIERERELKGLMMLNVFSLAELVLVLI